MLGQHLVFEELVIVMLIETSMANNIVPLELEGAKLPVYKVAT